MYLGQRIVMSFAAESVVADTLVPSVARANVKAAKNTAGRLSQWSMRERGFQRSSPYNTAPAEVTAIPMNAVRVKAVGMIKSCTYCL